MRILFAEDERSLSKAVVALLEKNNYSVDAVYDGEEALNYIEAGNYDAVILDIMMPVRDGISTLREIREREVVQGQTCARQKLVNFRHQSHGMSHRTIGNMRKIFLPILHRNHR